MLHDHNYSSSQNLFVGIEIYINILNLEISIYAMNFFLITTTLFILFLLKLSEYPLKTA